MSAEMDGRDRDPKRERWVPYEPGFWVFVFGDLTVFGVFFGTIAYFRWQDPAAFSSAENELGLGAANTLVLLLASLLMVSAVRAGRAGNSRLLIRRIEATAVCGVLFAAIKVVEYTQLLDGGHSAYDDDFYLAFFLFTGIHLVHVLVGVALLLWLRAHWRGPSSDTPALEGIGCYWHMVDAIWLVLFPLLYLTS